MSGVYLSPRTRLVLRYMLSKPDRDYTPSGIGRALTLQPDAVSNILARLIELGWVTDSRDRSHGFRLYRLVPDMADTAAAAAGVEPPAAPTVGVTDDGTPVEVWTMAKLRAAVADNRETAEFLAAVQAQLGTPNRPEPAGNNHPAGR